MAQRLLRALSRLGDIAVVGLLVIIGSLGVITVPVAMAAGTSALQHERVPDMLRSFFVSLKRTVRRGIIAGMLLAAATLAALANLLLVGPDIGRLVGALISVASIVMLFGVLVLIGPTSLMLVATGRPASVFRGSVMLLVLAPGRVLIVGVLLLVTVAAALVFPPFAVATAGSAAAVLAKLQDAIPAHLLCPTETGPCCARSCGRCQLTGWGTAATD